MVNTGFPECDERFPHPIPNLPSEGFACAHLPSEAFSRQRKSHPVARVTAQKGNWNGLLLLPSEHNKVVHVNFCDVSFLAIIGFVIAVYKAAFYHNLLAFL